MSPRQLSALHALADGPHTTFEIARRLDTTLPGAQKILDALYRRSLVLLTDTGRYCVSDRGRKKIGGA